MTLRVAHFVQRYPPALGGAEAYFGRLSRYLVAAGDAVTVFTTNALDLPAFWSRQGRCTPAGISNENGVAVLRFPVLRWPGRRYLLKALSLFPHRLWQCLTLPCNPISPSMWRAARRTPDTFDIVHATAFPYAWPIVCGLRLARRLRVPFCLTPFLHLGDPDDPHDPVRRAYTTPALLYLVRAADVVFVQTQRERDELCRRGISAEKLVLQGLGVAPEECAGGNRQATRRQWQVGDGEFVVGHLANQSREKGTIDLLLAAARLWQQGVPIRIVLAGPEMPNFQHFWKTFSAQHANSPVVRLGRLEDRQKKDFFAGLDAFALPSRTDSFGLVLLEAWANALPNVAYRAGGPAELIRHRSDGLLVPCGEIEQLGGALDYLAKSPAYRSRLGCAGRERTRREFQWGDKLDLVRQIYSRNVPAHLSTAAQAAAAAS
jgi:glycosyltransferase involved in cell wall biosynthesis